MNGDPLAIRDSLVGTPLPSNWDWNGAAALDECPDAKTCPKAAKKAGCGYNHRRRGGPPLWESCPHRDSAADAAGG